MKKISVDVTIAKIESKKVHSIGESPYRSHSDSNGEFLKNLEIKHRVIEFNCPIELTHEVIEEEFSNDYIILGWSVIQTYK